MAAASSSNILESAWTTMVTGGSNLIDQELGSPVGETLKKGRRAKESAREMASVKQSEQDQFERDVNTQEMKAEAQSVFQGRRAKQRAARAARSGRQSTILTGPSGAVSDLANIIPEKTLLGS